MEEIYGYRWIIMNFIMSHFTNQQIDTRSRLEFFSTSMEQLQNESLKNMMQEVVMENINDILQVGIKQTNNMPTVLILKG